MGPWVSNEFDRGGLRPTVGLRRPGRCLLRRRRPTPGAQRPERPISIGGKAFGRRSAGVPNEFGLQGPSADGRPAPTEKRSLRRRRPTPGAQRLGRPISIGVKACADREGVSCVGEGRRLARKRLRRPISIGVKAFGQRSACADRGGVFCVGRADAWRAALWEADFNRREGLRPAIGLCAE
jgi:hypothetical protein